MTVLDDIIAGVRLDLEERMAATSIAQLEERIAAIAPARPAIERLRGGGVRPVAIISEVKRRSPSKGALADIPDPAALAAIYADGGAAAISVLTEQRRFGGSLADLDAVRARVDIPVLRKDFMVSEYQILEARAHGADIILLMVNALAQDQLESYLALAHELGMTALVEAHTLDEVQGAVDSGAAVVGINARNLKTLDVDRAVFEQLAGAVPDNLVRVAESGVATTDHVQQYAQWGANAVLVGEALVTSGDPAATIASFTTVYAR